MEIVLVSHGSYAQATYESCQMIVGKIENVRYISFEQTMDQKMLEEKISDVIEQLPDKTEIVLITDIVGGTPNNVAIQMSMKNKNISVICGLSLALLLSIVTGTEPEKAIEETSNNIRLYGNIQKFSKINSGSNNTNSKNSEDLNPILNIRIDSRLIHGQVATMWTNKLRADRIMVIDDEIVKDPIQKTALKMAVPGGVHLSILTIAGAAERINSGKYKNQNVFMVVRDPAVLVKLYEKNVSIRSVNVGNMSTRSGSVQIAKSVAVTKEDIDNFEKLEGAGINLYHQMVPSDSAEEFLPMIMKVGKQR